MNSEIIETYWNVNEVNPLEKGGIQLEIIETYWNVNRGGESMAALTKLK